jgi:hypothetical protein
MDFGRQFRHCIDLGCHEAACWFIFCTVVGLILISAAILRTDKPEAFSLVNIFSSASFSSAVGRPPTLPCDRALASPERVRSEILALSRLANVANIATSISRNGPHESKNGS